MNLVQEPTLYDIQFGIQRNVRYHMSRRKWYAFWARVEHVFGVIKQQWGFRKVRNRGLEKNTAQLYTLFALANFHMADDRLLALQG